MYSVKFKLIKHAQSIIENIKKTNTEVAACLCKIIKYKYIYKRRRFNYLHLTQQAHHQASPLSKTICGDPAFPFHFFINNLHIEHCTRDTRSLVLDVWYMFGCQMN